MKITYYRHNTIRIEETPYPPVFSLWFSPFSQNPFQCSFVQNGSSFEPHPFLPKNWIAV